MKRDYYSRKNQVIAICIFLFLFFQGKIINWYDSVFVGPLLSSLDVNALTFILWIALTIGTFLVFRNHAKKSFRIGNTLTIFITLFLITYCYYRFISDRYSFTAIPLLNYIKLSDYFFLGCGGILYLRWLNYKSPFDDPSYENLRPFLIDAPLLSSGEDSFNRKEFATFLSKKIQTRPTMIGAGAFAIGINGTWGSGKTSFANMIREGIEPKNRITIEFNPWRSSTPERIVKDFFSLLISRLKEFDPALSKSITDYARTLGKIEENIIIKWIEGISDLFFDSFDKEENYKLINESINKIKKQVIVFIDDLDRLDTKEIVAVLRLIRNTANFDRVVYIVGYDREYISEAIKGFNPHNYKSFLEKIFQFEFQLPPFDSAILRNNIKDKLKENLEREFEGLIDAAVDYRAASGRSITNRIISTQRDVIRICNIIVFEIEKLKLLVNFIDFYFIQLLKLKFPKIYKFISDYRDLLFVKENKQQRLRLISERNIGAETESFDWLLGKVERDRENPENETIFEKYINSRSERDLSPFEKEAILEIMEELMREKNIHSGSVNRDPKSFVNYENFEYYLNAQLLSTDFTIHELDQTRGNYTEFKERIINWIRSGRISDVQDYLEKIVEFDAREEWWNYVLILIEVGKIQVSGSGVYGINYRQIVDLVNYPRSKNRENPIFFESLDQYLAWIKKFFDEAPSPCIFEGNILTAALKEVAEFSVTPEEIEKIHLSYLERYCRESKVVDDAVYAIWRNCITKESVKGHDPKVSNAANQLLKRFVREYLNGAQLGKFIRQSSIEVELFIIADEEWKFFFDSFEDFVAWINTAPTIMNQENGKLEMLRFLEAAKIRNYNAIEFEFKILKPIRWRTLP